MEDEIVHSIKTAGLEKIQPEMSKAVHIVELAL